MTTVEARIGTELDAYLHGRLHSDLRVDAVRPIPEGHSGFTYFVDAARDGSPCRLVLRLPPPGARISGPADVIRQGRIMAALHEQSVPVPDVVAIAEEPVVDGRPFVLMEAVEGSRIEALVGSAHPVEVAIAAIDALKAMQAVPVEKSGIGGEEPVSLDGELMRWAWLMERTPQELTGRAPELGTLLAADRPAERPPTLVHADYHYGNLLFRGSQVAAILDWEIAEIGQPLIDVGCICVMGARKRFDAGHSPAGAMEVPIDAVLSAYGADAGEVRWYLSFSCYKYAAILGYNLMLHRRGKRPDPVYEHMTGTISGLIDEGIAVLSDPSRGG